MPPLARVQILLTASLLASCAAQAPAPPPPSAPALASARAPASPSALAPASAPPLPATPAPALASAPAPEGDVPPLLRSLPAVSSDGKRIAVWAHYTDGARGEPKSELLEISAETDHVFVRINLEDPDAHLPDSELPRRLLAAEATLAKETWKPLTPLEITEDTTKSPRLQGVGESTVKLASDARLTIRFFEPEFSVELDKKLALKRSFPAWSDKPHKDCAECLACPAALADLDRVYADADARAALIVIRYGGGTDTCWERDESYHALRF